MIDNENCIVIKHEKLMRIMLDIFGEINKRRNGSLRFKSRVDRFFVQRIFKYARERTNYVRFLDFVLVKHFVQTKSPLTHSFSKNVRI